MENITNLLVGGLSTNHNPINQPEHTTTFTKNAVYNTDTGDNGLITNERGFSKLADIFQNEDLIGCIPLNKGDAVLYTKAKSSLLPVERILYFNGKTVRELVNRNDLDFSLTHEITGGFDFNYKGERIVYWVDKGRNDARCLNVDDVPTGLTLNQLSVFGLDLLVPNVTVEEVLDTGGVLKTAVYYMHFKYVDASGNESNWLSYTNLIPVVNESKSSANYAGDTYDGAAPGTVTSKSIRLALTNIDRTYKYLVVGATRVMGGMIEPFVVDKVAITGSTMKYIYTGNTTHQPVDIASVLVDKVAYRKPKYQHIFNKTLFYASLQEREEADFQQYVNGIKSATLVRSFQNSDITTNFKTEVNTNKYQGFAADEVVPLAIELVYKDGNEGRPYHIPAREVGTTQFGGSIHASENTDVLASNANNPFNEDAKFWRIYNTGAGGPGISEYSGTFLCENGYWESTEAYPENKDYPTGNIRHHRISDNFANFIRGADGNVHYRLAGIKLGNIVIPKHIREKIQGFRILRGVRDESDRSIITKGIAYTSFIQSVGGNWQLNLTQKFNQVRSTEDRKYLFIFSPEIQFEKPSVAVGDYVRIKGKAHGEIVNYGTAANGDTKIGTTLDTFDGTAGTLWDITENYKIEQVAYISADVLQTVPNLDLYGVGDNEVQNTTGQSCLMVKLDRPIPTTYFDNFFPSGLTPDGAECSGLYVYIKRSAPDQYNKLEDIQYVSTGYEVMGLSEDDFNSADVYIPSIHTNSAIDIFGGDVFISQYAFRRFAWTNVSARDAFRTLIQSFPESTLNMAYRHEGTGDGDKYCPATLQTDVLEINAEFDNSSLYNFDYSRISRIELKLPQLDDRVDIINHENRVIYSLKNNTEAIYNPYRQFLADNYTDISYRKGKITDLFSENNRLLVHTELSLWDTHSNFQTLNASENNLYIGTGGLFAMDAQEIEDSSIGEGGSRNSSARICTPFGTFFIDINSSKVFLINSQGLQEISEDGMYSFFQNNAKFSLVEELKELDYEFTNVDNPCNPYSIGWLVTYDPLHKRILFTKRDYKLTQSFRDNFLGELPDSLYSVGSVYAKNGEFYRIDAINGPVKQALDTSSYFTTNHLTVSYGFNPVSKKMNWVSFHDYIPTNTFTLSDKRVFVRQNKGTMNKDLYEHNKGDYGKFFDTIYPFVIEGVFHGNPMQNKILASLKVESYGSYLSNGERIVDRDLFFNKLWIYNDRQASGEITLQTQSLLANFIKDVTLSRTQKEWRIDKFYDKVSSDTEPIFIKNGIDKDFNPLALNSSAWYNEGRFLYTHFVIRFIHNNLENRKISVYLISADYLVSTI